MKLKDIEIYCIHIKNIKIFKKMNFFINKITNEFIDQMSQEDIKDIFEYLIKNLKMLDQNKINTMIKLHQKIDDKNISSNYSILHIICEQVAEEICEDLVITFINQGADINQKQNGISILELAIQNHKYKLAKYLISINFKYDNQLNKIINNYINKCKLEDVIKKNNQIFILKMITI